MRTDSPQQSRALPASSPWQLMASAVDAGLIAFFDEALLAPTRVPLPIRGVDGVGFGIVDECAETQPSRTPPWPKLYGRVHGSLC